MDINPDDAQQYLQGVEYPASKEDIVSAAENNGAPDDLMEMPTGLSRPEFSEEKQVLEDLRFFPRPIRVGFGDRVRYLTCGC